VTEFFIVNVTSLNEIMIKNKAEIKDFSNAHSLDYAFKLSICETSELNHLVHVIFLK